MPLNLLNNSVLLFILFATVSVSFSAAAQEQAVVTVDGGAITESDLKIAEAEIGDGIGKLVGVTRRRVLIEYMIENRLFANAARRENILVGKEYQDRVEYWRVRAERDLYFEKLVKGGVREEDAKAYYDKQAKDLKARGEKKVPSFGEVRDRIMNQMIKNRANDVAAQLRAASKIEYIDPEIKKNVDDQNKKAN